MGTFEIDGHLSQVGLDAGRASERTIIEFEQAAAGEREGKRFEKAAEEDFNRRNKIRGMEEGRGRRMEEDGIFFF